MARQFGIEFTVDDKGSIAVIDKAGLKLRELGLSAADLAPDLAPANEELGRLRTTSDAAGKSIVDLGGDLVQIATASDPLKAAINQLENRLGQFAERALESKEAAKLLGENWQATAGQIAIAAGAAAAAGAVIFGSVVEVAEAAAAISDLREELDLLSVSQNAHRVETDRQVEVYNRLADQIGVSEAELRKLHPTLEALLEEAKKDPGGQIAKGFDELTRAAKEARQASIDLAEQERKMREARAEAEDFDAWSKWADTVRNVGEEMGATTGKLDEVMAAQAEANKAAADGEREFANLAKAMGLTNEQLAEHASGKGAEGLKNLQLHAAANPEGAIAQAMRELAEAADAAGESIFKVSKGPSLAQWITDAKNAANAASDAALKAVGDAMMAGQQIGDSVTAGAIKGVEGINLLGTTVGQLAKQLQISFALPSQVESSVVGSKAQINALDRLSSVSAASPLNRSELESAREAVERGDVGALSSIIDMLQSQAKVERIFGGAASLAVGGSGADKMAFMLQDILRQLQAAAASQPREIASAVKEAVTGMTVSMDAVTVGYVVADQWNRGKVPTAPGFG